MVYAEPAGHGFSFTWVIYVIIVLIVLVVLIHFLFRLMFIAPITITAQPIEQISFVQQLLLTTLQ